MSNNKLNQFLTQKMSRKQFLVYLGLGFLSLIGISDFLKKLSDPSLFRKKATQGFGSDAYGGKEKV